MTASQLQKALARGKPVWGGWITGPTAIGPEEFARAGYDYVGFARRTRRPRRRRYRQHPAPPRPCGDRHGGAAALVDPAPIGRVLDAGADAIIVAMIE